MWLYYTASTKNHTRVRKVLAKLRKSSNKNKAVPRWIIRLKHFDWNWLIKSLEWSSLVNTFQSFSSLELTSSFTRETLQGHSRKISFLPSCPVFSPHYPILWFPKCVTSSTWKNSPPPGASPPPTCQPPGGPRSPNQTVPLWSPLAPLSPLSCPPQAQGRRPS